MSYMVHIKVGDIDPSKGEVLLEIDTITPDGHVVGHCHYLKVEEMVALSVQTEEDKSRADQQEILELARNMMDNYDPKEDTG